MTHDEQHAAELVRTGQYFKEARKWYTAMYIGPIPERSFFLVISVMAAIIGLVGFWSLISLMPLKERPALMIRNERMDDAIPELYRLRRAGMSLNDALRTYYLRQYVYSRETYFLNEFQKNSLYVMAYSDPAVAQAYADAITPDNPASPYAQFGGVGSRNTFIQSVDLRGGGEVETAVVKFSTEISGISVDNPRTQWTATVQFNYSDAVEIPAVDANNEEQVTKLQEPEFKVVGYELQEN